MRLGGESLTPTGPLAQSAGGLIPKGTRVDVFQQIYWVFLILGTLVGIVVIGYMLYNAYKYRDRDGRTSDDDAPRLGELPTGSGGGRKLFFSFGLSTIIVVSLIVWTYGTLLYVEQEPPDNGNGVEVEVVGYQFGWEFIYPNGHKNDTLVVPQGETIHLQVNSTDVFHTFGVPELRVKTDAIPGQITDTWFVANETGTYEARCFELCGASHSYMTAEVVVMEPDEYEEWYANTSNSSESESLAADGALAARSGGPLASGEVTA